MNIYVGNLSFQTSEDDLKTLFEKHGEVQTVKMVKDRETGRSRGFAFVEMAEEDGSTAIEALNGIEMNGRNLTVNEAHDKKPAGRGGFNQNSNNRRFDRRRPY